MRSAHSSGHICSSLAAGLRIRTRTEERVYERVQSVLLAALMHVPIVADSYVLRPPASSSTFIATSHNVFAAVLWIVLAAIYVASRGRLSARTTTRVRLAWWSR